MTWKNDYTKPLYCVKRRYCEEYHTGGYRTGSQPQLYKIGHAKQAANRLNKLNNLYEEKPLTLEEYREANKCYKTSSHIKDFDEWSEKSYKIYLTNYEKGPWVVAEVQFTASEYSEPCPKSKNSKKK